jgi:hypothetical protein
MRKLIITLVSIILPAIHVLSYAEQSSVYDNIFKRIKGKSLEDTNLVKGDSLLLLLKKEEDRRNAWSLAVEGSFTSDEAEDKTTADLNTKVDMTRGEYPQQFRFIIESRIRLRDDKFEDDVTAFLLNYDYYVHRFAETYAFVERFSDNYMDIKQRFEIGIGFKIELTELFGQTPLLGLFDNKDTVLVKRLAPPKALNSEEMDSLEHYRETALISIRKRDARLRASIALSFFRELEQAEIGGKDTTLPSEERFRFVLRPLVKIGITKHFDIGGHCYLKLPAFEPRKKNGDWDYRVDAQCYAKLTLSEGRYGNDKVSLNVRYDIRFDNTPPSAELNGTQYTASKFHGTARLGISVKI